tara:strand:- start:125 stop:1303 length:1179 start_codon:yes stop_codon:yes gene_type:complete
MSIITENTVKIQAELPKSDPTKKIDVFYNPVMESNRNISVLLLNSISNKEMNIALPLCGSGVRGLRFLKELKKGKINHLWVNDIKENFPELFSDCLKRNKLSKKNVTVRNVDANLFLQNEIDENKPNGFCGYFDYIDIDPYGSPNPFLASSVARICRNGVLAITSTDTAALTGTYPKVTKRKYWATTVKNHMMHEFGLRILIRKVQMQGIQFDKALTPILSYYKDHYFRIFFRSEKGKTKCDEIIKQHQFLLFCQKCLAYEVSKQNSGMCGCGNAFVFHGPLWVGELQDNNLLKKMVKSNQFENEKKFLETLSTEKDIVGFYDLHEIARKHKIEIPKIETVLKKVNGTRTHFSPNGVKTDKTIKEMQANAEFIQITSAGWTESMSRGNKLSE